MERTSRARPGATSVARAEGAERHVLSCGLYLHPHGFEVRCGYGNEEDLLMSHVERTPETAKARGEEWPRAAVSGQGLLRGHVRQGQQVLRRLIVGRLTLTPTEHGYYTFSRTGMVRPVLAGVILPFLIRG